MCGGYTSLSTIIFRSFVKNDFNPLPFCYSLSGNTPFSSDRNGKTMDEQIKSGHYVMSRTAWEGVSTAAKEIVREMMTLDAEKRISLSQIFEHPWLQVKLYLENESTYGWCGLWCFDMEAL